MKEYGRKPYLSKNYWEMMHRKTNSEVWAKTLEKHSEFEKPYQYKAGEYPQMQHYRPTIPGLSFDVEGFDFDSRSPDGTYYNIDPYGPVTPEGITETGKLIFWCPQPLCYCLGQTKCWSPGCTREIVNVEYSYTWDQRSGVTFTFTKTEICFTAVSDASPILGINIDIFMRAPNPARPGKFIYGWHKGINVSECDSALCCPCDTETPVISYTTQSMQIDETQELSVGSYGVIGPDCFTWAITSGGGTISDESGYTTTYTAPSTNAECAYNPTISLRCNNVEVKTLEIAINANTGDTLAYTHLISGPSTDDCVSGDCSGGGSGYLCWQIARYKCDGTYIDSSNVWYAVYPVTCDYVPGGGAVYTCVGYLYCKPAPTTALDAMITYQAQESRTLGDHTDERSAQMITDGCCPGVLL